MPLTDAQWARIEPLLPDRTPKRGGRWRGHREVIDAIAYTFQTGTQWMHLPENYATGAVVSVGSTIVRASRLPHQRVALLVAKRREDDRQWPVQEFREISSSFCHEHAVEEIHPPYLILWPRAILQIVPGSDSWIRRSVFGSILVVLAVGEAVQASVLVPLCCVAVASSNHVVQNKMWCCRLRTSLAFVDGAAPGAVPDLVPRSVVGVHLARARPRHVPICDARLPVEQEPVTLFRF
ncbi:transposase [Streptomyces sp. NPDC003642]